MPGRSRGDTARAVVVSLVPLGALAALGGAYPSSTIPILAGSAAAFLLSRARVAATPSTRWLDLSLVAVIALIVLQMLPLPDRLVVLLSPQAPGLQNMLALRPALSNVAGSAPNAVEGNGGAMRPTSIDPRLTREGLAAAMSCVLLFWAARETFARGGGVRIFTRAVAWSGFAVAFIALIQRATAPTLLLWRWTPIDPGAKPYGPFVNRNHFATWLLLAAAITVGYLVTRIRSHGFEQHQSRRLLARDLLADGSTLILAGCLGAMLVALVSSLSRAALLGLAAASAFGLIRARRARLLDVSAALGSAIVVVVLAASIWMNLEGLLGRFQPGGTNPSRLTIWRETLPVLEDFWLVGTGLGTYGTAMLRYQVTRPDTLFNQAHNEYLQFATEGGLLLALAAAAVLWNWLRAARHALTDTRYRLHWIRLGAAAGLCGVAVQSVFEAGLRMPANALLLSVLAAIVIGRDQSSGEAVASRPRRAQPSRNTRDDAAGVG